MIEEKQEEDIYVVIAEPGSSGYVNPLQPCDHDQQDHSAPPVVVRPPESGLASVSQIKKQEMQRTLGSILSTFGWNGAGFIGMESLIPIDYFEYRRRPTCCGDEKISICNKQGKLLYFWSVFEFLYLFLY